MDDRTFRDRRFALAVGFSLAGAVALVWGKISGGEFVALATVVLGLYGGVEALSNRGK